MKNTYLLSDTEFKWKLGPTDFHVVPLDTSPVRIKTILFI